MEPVEPTTNLDPLGRSSWHIDDIVVRLRLWATEYAHRLPDTRVALSLGSGTTCDVQLHDDSGRLSREHAMLVPDPTGWELLDLESRNGLKVDGAPAIRRTLQAGAKIELGGLTLVAESLRFIGLRALVCRLIGWAPDRQAAVDEALQNLRDCAMHRTRLVLLGDDDLAPVALRLHRATLGPSAPFLRCDGDDVSAAIRAAMHGTLCVPIRRRATASAIADAVHAVALAARPRLVLCASNAGDAAAMSAKPARLAVIAIPPLSRARGGELATDPRSGGGRRPGGRTPHVGQPRDREPDAVASVISDDGPVSCALQIGDQFNVSSVQVVET